MATDGVSWLYVQLCLGIHHRVPLAIGEESRQAAACSSPPVGSFPSLPLKSQQVRRAPRHSRHPLASPVAPATLVGCGQSDNVAHVRIQRPAGHFTFWVARALVHRPRGCPGSGPRVAECNSATVISRVQLCNDHAPAAKAGCNSATVMHLADAGGVVL